ncbi:zinc finger CCCH domain-containing protein 10-like, partial [Tropilaelaps mercedesae]
MASVGNLERENQMLRERLEDMQKQVKDLMSTNEFLLQQNAELRLSKHQAQAQAARACSGMSGHAGAAVMSTAGAVISNNVQQQLAAAASNVIPSSVLTSSVLQSVQSAANSLPAGVGAVGPVGAV